MWACACVPCEEEPGALDESIRRGRPGCVRVHGEHTLCIRRACACACALRAGAWSTRPSSTRAATPPTTPPSSGSPPADTDRHLGFIHHQSSFIHHQSSFIHHQSSFIHHQSRSSPQVEARSPPRPHGLAGTALPIPPQKRRSERPAPQIRRSERPVPPQKRR